MRVVLLLVVCSGCSNVLGLDNFAYAPAADTTDSGSTVTQGDSGIVSRDSGATIDSGTTEMDSSMPTETSDACTPVTHSNGVGQTWTDCVPLGTYNETQALEACGAFAASVNGNDGICTYSNQFNDCSPNTAVTTTTTMGVWAYAGGSVGHVARSGCPTSSDPTWN